MPSKTNSGVIEDLSRRVTNIEAIIKKQPTKKDMAKVANDLSMRTKKDLDDRDAERKKVGDAILATLVTKDFLAETIHPIAESVKTNTKIIPTLATLKDIEDLIKVDKNIRTGSRVIGAAGYWVLRAFGLVGAAAGGWLILHGAASRFVHWLFIH